MDNQLNNQPTNQLAELEQQIQLNSNEQQILQTNLFNAKQQLSNIQFQYAQSQTLGKHLQNQLSELKRSHKQQEKQLKQSQQSQTEKRPVGRPRKATADLAPSTQYLYNRLDKIANKPREPNKFDKHYNHHNENDQRLYKQFDSYIKATDPFDPDPTTNAEYTKKECLEFFIKDLQRCYLPQRIHTANSELHYANSNIGDHHPQRGQPNSNFIKDTEELTSWHNYLNTLNSVVTYFATQLQITPEELIGTLSYPPLQQNLTYHTLTPAHLQPINLTPNIMNNLTVPPVFK